MFWTNNQRSWVGGRLDHELSGRQDIEKYYQGASELKNMLVRRQGLVYKRRGTKKVDSSNGSYSPQFSNDTRLIPFADSENVGQYLILTNSKAYLCNENGVCNTAPVSTGLADNVIKDIDYVQSGDTIFFVHRSVKPFYIRRSVDGSSYSITKANINFKSSGTYDAPSITATTAGTQGGGSYKIIHYKAVYVDSTGLESYASRSVSVKYQMPWASGFSVRIYITNAAGQADPHHYNVYKDDGSGYGYIGQMTKDDQTQQFPEYFSDDNITPDMSNTPADETSAKTFSTPNNYPSVIGFFQQRMVLGSSNNDPFTFWMSCTGDLYNFSTHSSIRDDDSITASIAATDNPILNHIVVGKEMMIFARDGEWEVSAVSGNTLTYKTVSAKMQSSIGCSRRIKPIRVGNEIIYVDQSERAIYATRYNLNSDGYESKELTVLSQWLFKGSKIKNLAYKRFPDSTLYAVLEDGTIACLTYMQEHEVCAWSTIEFGGGWKAIDVATTSKVTDGCTEVLFLVKNGSTFELWRDKYDTPSKDTNVSLAEYCCLDGQRTAEATTPQGMVRVGENEGYSFNAEVASMFPEAKGSTDSIQFEIKDATTARVRVMGSGDFSIKMSGQDDTKLRSAGISVPYTDATTNVNLVSKDCRFNMAGINSRDGRIIIKSNTVLPLNILLLATTYSIEGENANGDGNG